MLDACDREDMTASCLKEGHNISTKSKQTLKILTHWGFEAAAVAGQIRQLSKPLQEASHRRAMFWTCHPLMTYGIMCCRDPARRSTLRLLVLREPFLFLALVMWIQLCGWQGLGALTWDSEVGELNTGHCTIRDLPAPHNINWQELSQTSPSQC